ncbi:MAG: carbamoyltransferase HypF [Gammaproteobacteria bacterium]
MSAVLERPDQVTRRLRIGGRVQGVGFRPLVYRLAEQYQLSGQVSNLSGVVEVIVSGPEHVINAFRDALLQQGSTLAVPKLIDDQTIETINFDTFHIRTSTQTSTSHLDIPADTAPCPDCLHELRHRDQRRYHYPFINCTQCGPRYTLIEQLPYERRHTSMAGFVLCPACQAEYDSPGDRRFHAEASACPECGPQILLQSADACISDVETILETLNASLAAGEVIAIKGVGGYHLMCDALNPQAVMRLRQRKHRPDKPLAVMFPMQGEDGLDAVRQHVHLSPAARTQLCRAERPIVLCAQREGSSLAAAIAPGLYEIGVLLPYSPLHYLISAHYARPLVMTSANLSGEPVLIDNDDATRHLVGVADAVLHHNRPIRHAADDSVVQIVHRQPQRLRLGRGLAPLHLRLPFQLTTPTLAVGGHGKNSIALAWEDRVVISPHIGDLSSVRAMQRFAESIDSLQSLYGISAQRLVCDQHPDYASSRWADNSGLITSKVWHHHAHAAQLHGEYPDEQRWLVFTWDGTGLGEDHSLWGGDALLGRPGDWQRVASFVPFRLPGGDAASRHPWRTAVSLCQQAGYAWCSGQTNAPLVREALQKGINCPESTSVGRLFDAAAAMLHVCEQSQYEAQAAMQLQACCRDNHGDAVELPLLQDTHGVWRSDWSPLLPLLNQPQTSVAQRAANFHHSLAGALVQQAMQSREQYGAFAVGLSGGVFQNRYLTEMVMDRLQQHDFRVYLPQAVPVNDGGLCYGQILQAACQYGWIHATA